LARGELPEKGDAHSLFGALLSQLGKMDFIVEYHSMKASVTSTSHAMDNCTTLALCGR
jgi:hypothetical protein